MKVLSFLEALSVTGPAKNLLDFGVAAREGEPRVEFQIATFRRPHQLESDCPFLNAARAQGIQTHVIAEKSAFDPGVIARMSKLVRELDPDIVQTHNVKSNFLFCLTGLFREYPWLAWHHWYTRPTPRQAAYNKLDWISLRFSRRVVTVTKAFREELMGAGVASGRIEVIANAIQPGWMDGERPVVEGDQPRTVLAIGRLSSEKAHADLVEAIAWLQDSGRLGFPLRLVLVGEGHERQNLEAMAGRLRVEVEFAGQVSDVRPFFKRSQIFVLPSLSEGSPNVLIEAMAAGIPIVATRAGGIPETVEDGREALLVDAGQPKALGESMAELLGDVSRARGLAMAARARALEEFSPRARARKMVSIYGKELLGQGAGVGTSTS